VLAAGSARFARRSRASALRLARTLQEKLFLAGLGLGTGFACASLARTLLTLHLARFVLTLLGTSFACTFLGTRFACADLALPLLALPLPPLGLDFAYFPWHFLCFHFPWHFLCLRKVLSGRHGLCFGLVARSLHKLRSSKLWHAI
jgi:hypothetical protein